MKPKTVTYRRVFNVGNYESVTLELSYDLEDGDNIDDSILAVKEKVREHAPVKKKQVSEIKPDAT